MRRMWRNLPSVYAAPKTESIDQWEENWSKTSDDKPETVEKRLHVYHERIRLH